MSSSGGWLLAMDYPGNPFDPAATRLIGLSTGEEGDWWLQSNIRIDPSFDPVRALGDGVIYVQGLDLLDENKPKLFLLESATGEVWDSIEDFGVDPDTGERPPLCTRCMVAVAADGVNYVNERGSSKIYKLR